MRGGYRGPALLQVLVDRLFNAAVYRHRRVVVERQRLHHHDDAELLDWIDEKVSIEDSGPRAATRRAPVRQFLRGELKPEPPLVLTCARWEVPRQRQIHRLLFL